MWVAREFKGVEVEWMGCCGVSGRDQKKEVGGKNFYMGKKRGRFLSIQKEKDVSIFKNGMKFWLKSV